MRLFHYVLVYMGDLHLVHPALNFSVLDDYDNGTTSKFDDVLLEHGGLPYVLPFAVQVEFFFGGQLHRTILR